jgi:hypothetical protein
MNNNTHQYKMTRRVFLRTTATAATAAVAANVLPGCLPTTPTIPPPPGFPAGIALYQQQFENWAREVITPDLWFCSPQSGADLVTLANWARAHNYRLRPFGSGHGFSPALMPRRDDGDDVVLINTHDHLTNITVNAADRTVTCGAGAYLVDICRALETHDLGLYHTTAPGGVSVAGGLAMNVHGAAMPRTGETLEPGHSWGTLSNLVLSLTAVVWDEDNNTYALKTFQRDDPAIGPFLTCIARAFTVEVTLQAGPNLKIRCVSTIDRKTQDLFAHPDVAGPNSFSNLSDTFGTVDTIFYPLATAGTAWVKTWTVTPVKPAESREVTAPFNYQTGNLSPAISDSLAKSLRKNPLKVPDYNNTAQSGFATIFADTNPATQVYDLWGSAYTTTFYVRPETIRLTVAAWGVIVRRADMQRVLHEFHTKLNELLTDYASRGLYPYVGPIELRAHGVDKSSDVLIANAVEPWLSGARPHPNFPDNDTIIWFAINNNVDQPEADDFNNDLENWFVSNYSSYGVVRPEWTKAHAFTKDAADGGAWSNLAKLQQTFPDTFRDGYPSDSNWDAAVAALNGHDPHRVFSNSYLDMLFPA